MSSRCLSFASVLVCSFVRLFVCLFVLTFNCYLDPLEVSLAKSRQHALVQTSIFNFSMRDLEERPSWRWCIYL